MRLLTTHPNVAARATFPFIYWDGLLTEEELKEIEQHCAKHGTDQSKVVNNGQVIEDDKFRKSNVRLHVASEDNTWLFNKLFTITDYLNGQFFNFDLLGFEYFQYTEYEGLGSHYDWHMDSILGDSSMAMSELPRKLSLSLILSDSSEYEGGDFEFLVSNKGDPLIAEQKRGRVIAFPSYMLHRVKPLTSGKRRSLVFWAVGPKFK